MLVAFIWNDKRAKINFKILQGLKSDGGAGLSNIVHRERSLKLQWVYRLQESEILQNIADALLENSWGNSIWEAQLSKKHAKKMIKGKTFWHTVLHWWLEYKFKPPSNMSEVLNSHMCIEGKPIYFKEWACKGIKTFKDICHTNRFFTRENLKQKYDINSTYLEYYGILEAIPNNGLPG